MNNEITLAHMSPRPRDTLMKNLARLKPPSTPAVRGNMEGRQLNSVRLVCVLVLASFSICLPPRAFARDPLLISAVLDNDVPLATKILSGGINVNAKNEARNTALVYAVFNDNTEMVRLLIAHGADVNAIHRSFELTGLMIAADNGNVEVARMLVQHGANVNAAINDKTALDVAVLKEFPPSQPTELDQEGAKGSRGNLPIVKLLVERGAKIGKAYGYAVSSGNDEIINYFEGRVPNLRVSRLKKELDRDLIHAAREGEVDKVSELLVQGASANARDDCGGAYGTWHCTAFWWSINKTKLDVAEVLLKHHANINSPGDEGMSPLQYAAYEGNFDATKFLIEHNADVNFTIKTHNIALNEDSRTQAVLAGVVSQDKFSDTEKMSLMQLLLKHGARLDGQYGAEALISNVGGAAYPASALDRASFLLKHGANVNARDADGETALTYAAAVGYLEMVKLLVKHGADISLRNSNGKSAVDRARENNFMDIPEFLDFALKHRPSKEMKRPRSK